MTVPGRVDAAALLLSLDPPTWFLRHSQAVAEVASWLAERIAFAGVPVDRALVEAAALLHDVDKLLPADDRAKRLPHGDGSADWLGRQGHPELSRAVASHPVTKLVDGDAFRRWAAFATREERVVAYADKRAGQRLESMDERFASWSRRYPDGPASDGASWSGELAREVRARADRLEADVCRAAEISPPDVRRAPWTAKALATARERVANRT
jgi:putative nucleotidyltransferase with HDIG domain